MGLERSVVWDDINGDGVVESVRLSTLPTAGQSSEDQVPPSPAPRTTARWAGGHSPVRVRVMCSGWAQCWALGQSGVPPQEDLFNVSICEPKPQGFLELLTSNPKRKSRGDTYTCPPPPNLPSHHPPRLMCLLLVCSGVLRATNPISIARPRTWAEPNGHKHMVRAAPNGIG